MDLGLINGLTDVFIQEIGNKISYMVKVYTLGLMAEVMMVNIRTIKSMGTVHMFGQMVKYMKDTGIMENSMVKESTLIVKVKLNMENGMKERL